MRLFRLSIRNIISRPLTTILSIMLLALGIGMISLTFQVTTHVEANFTKNIKGIDMVVGAKGSPLQLILSAVYHLDAPTGNIQLMEVQSILKNKLVDFGIPLSYGDSHEGYRIVGTNHQYPALYGASLSNGRLWDTPFEVTIGSLVRERLHLQIGDTFSGTHGLTTGGEMHEDHVYRVVGILGFSNSVLDQLILTGTESVWKTHRHEEEADHHDHDVDHELEHEEEQQITAMLIGFKSPMAMVSLPRMINEKTSMQAAVPVYEIDRLFGLMGMSMDVIKYIAFAIITVSGLSIFISLFNALKERKYELALMRTYGASPWQLLWVTIQEGLILTSFGFLVGLTLGRVGLSLISILTESNYHYTFSLWNWTPQDWLLLISTLGIGFIVSIFPAFQAFRLDISKTLSNV